MSETHSQIKILTWTEYSDSWAIYYTLYRYTVYSVLDYHHINITYNLAEGSLLPLVFLAKKKKEIKVKHTPTWLSIFAITLINTMLKHSTDNYDFCDQCKELQCLLITICSLSSDVYQWWAGQTIWTEAERLMTDHLMANNTTRLSTLWWQTTEYDTKPNVLYRDNWYTSRGPGLLARWSIDNWFNKKTPMTNGNGCHF